MEYVRHIVRGWKYNTLKILLEGKITGKRSGGGVKFYGQIALETGSTIIPQKKFSDQPLIETNFNCGSSTFKTETTNEEEYPLITNKRLHTEMHQQE